MSMPKKRQVNISPAKRGQERIDELLNSVDPKTSYFPPGISIKDLENGFKEFIEELNFTLDGKKIPVVFLPSERWAEFSKSWKYLDKDKNPIMPLISIRRSSPPAPGTSLNKLYNIPGRKTFTYMRVPTFSSYRGADIYKIPQPIQVDCRFQLFFLSKYIQDINKFAELILTDFSSRQSYTKIKNFYMPIILEDDPSDESTIEDFSGDRFYKQVYNFNLMGYIQNEDEFEIKPAVQKIIMFQEVDSDFITLSGNTVLSGE